MRHLIIALLLFSFINCSNSKHKIKSLENKIRQEFESVEGTFALAFVNLADTSQKILINSQEMFHAASTMKTPVMIEVFKQAEQGKFNLSDSILVKNKFYSIVDSSTYSLDMGADSNEELYKLIGQKRTIHDLIVDMITSSSNLATNILVDLVGAKNAQQTMRGYGAENILVLRGVEDLKAYRKGLSNRTNAHDEMVIYKALARGEAVSDTASAKMINILSRQEFNEMIPAGLPDSIQVAHKTGWITGVNHDCALVLLPDGRKYVLILLSKEAPNREKVHNVFADISNQIYNFVLQY